MMNRIKRALSLFRMKTVNPMEYPDEGNKKYYYASCLAEPVMEHVIFFESNEGFSMEGNPRALFEQLLKDSEYKETLFVWVARNRNILKELRKGYAENPRVQFVISETKGYSMYLAKAKVLISDKRLPVWFIKRKEQIYIQAGSRFENFKKGYELEGVYLNSIRIGVKDYLSSDIILSPSKCFTEEILEAKYKLTNLYEGNIIEGFLPKYNRIHGMAKGTAKESCRLQGLLPDKKQVLLTFGKAGIIEKKVLFCKELQQILSAEYQVCMKVSMSEFVPMKKLLEGTDILLLKNFFDMDCWLAAADYLIGDGAGYTFDYLATGRMIIFTDLYGFQKGQLLSGRKLPGPTAHIPEDAAAFIREEEEYRNEFQSCYESFSRNYLGSEDSTPVFHQGEVNKGAGRRLSGNKKKLLFMTPLAELDRSDCGAWQWELYQLLHKMDYDKYDVTVLTTRPKAYSEENMVEKSIDKRARVLYRTGFLVQQEEEFIRHKSLMGALLFSEDFHEIRSQMNQEDFQNEWLRLCGQVTFDTVIGFGTPIPMFLILTDQLMGPKKIFFSRYQDKPVQIENNIMNKKERRAANILESMKIYDEIISTEEEKKKFTEQYCRPLMDSNYPQDEVHPMIEYRGQNYEVNERWVTEDQQLTMILVPKEEL